MTCYSVSQLNEVARLALSAAFKEDTWVVGEISGLKNHAKTGHIYFDLVEKTPQGHGQYLAKVNCAFFHGSYLTWLAHLKKNGFDAFDLRDGLEVKMRVRVDLYAKEGRYQLIVSEIDPHYSLGAIARKRAQTIEALKTAGLLEKNQRLGLSDCPLSIGLITSYGSAAYNDFMSILKQSAYAFQITLFDAHMQGDRTAPEVVTAIHVLEKRPLDLIAIVRGGGAKMDLVYFDDIAICRAIANCACPVITGIGHEIDLSVSDLVSFRHFVTPTDVARFLVTRLDDLWARIEQAELAIAPACRQALAGARERLYRNAAQLAFQTKGAIMQSMQTLHSLSHTFSARCLRSLSQEHANLGRLLQSMASASAFTIRTLTAHIATYTSNVSQASFTSLQKSMERLAQLEAYLALMDPHETLKRGFSITLDKHGQALFTSDSVTKGDPIATVLSQGRIFSLVQDKERL